MRLDLLSSGKTTLLNLISGLLNPDKGAIYFKGRSVNGTSQVTRARQGIGRTFQSVKLFRSLTVEDNIWVALRNKPDESLVGAVLGNRAGSSAHLREKVSGLLNEFRLYEHRTQRAGELSYGQQKLLHLAMAMANPFDLLLLDEPVAGLQPSFVDQISAKLLGIDRTVIVVEHNLDFIKGLGAEVLFLSAGRIIARGSYEAVMGNPTVRESYL